MNDRCFDPLNDIDGRLARLFSSLSHSAEPPTTKPKELYHRKCDRKREAVKAERKRRKAKAL